jgi:hypothetical protein
MGIWTMRHPGYAQESQLLLDAYQKDVSELEVAMANIPSEDGEIDYYFYKVVSPIRDKADMSYTKLILMCCMTIESFVNFYGVKRLGERYYVDNVERLSIIQKIVNISAICFENIYRNLPKEIDDVKILFKIRNDMVHSKTREYQISDIVDKPEIFNAPTFTRSMGIFAYESMVSILLWFQKHDSEIDLEGVLSGDT